MTTMKLLAAVMIAMTAVGSPTSTETLDAPPVVQEETFKLDLSEGMPVEDFLALYARITERRVFWDARRLAGTRVVKGVGDMTFSHSEADDVFGTILMMHGLAGVPHGDPARRFTFIDDIKTSQNLKQGAIPVSRDELAMTPPDRVVALVLPLKHLDCQRTQRALNNLIQEHRAGFVQPIAEANALLLCNFAGTVKTMAKLVDEMEQVAATETAKTYRAQQAAEQGQGN